MTDLPLYPLPMGSCLSFPWVEMRHQKLLGSRWRAVMTRHPEAGFFGVLLWFEALRQDPAGTLPDDDFELAMLAGLGTDVGRWQGLREAALYGWRPCLVAMPEEAAAGPPVPRLMHRTVTEVALVAWGHAQKARAGRADATRGRRLRRVAEALRKTPLRSRAARSPALAEAVLAWIEERGLAIRQAVVVEALEALSAGGVVVQGVDFGAR